MPIINVVAATQVAEALKLLTGQTESLHRSLMQFDVWRNEWRRIALKERAPECSTCVLHRFGSLDADDREFAAILCGRHAVQISPAQPVQIDLVALRQRLQPAGEVNSNEYLLRFRTGDYELTVFQDARSIIRGTDDIATARSLYAKYIGN
jgi:adenylyltransferase/sulfurtransferase